MRTTRLFSPVRLSGLPEVELGAFEANYVARVLRLKCGDELIVFDGTGGEYRATLRSATRRSVSLELGAFAVGDRLPARALTLVQGVSRGERMDLVIQKATELGVERISPVLTEYSQVRLDAKRARQRQAHWQAIAVNACQQCGRNRLPIVEAPLPFADWLARPSAETAARYVMAPEASRPLVDLLNGDAHGTELLVGPEGGLSPSELRDSTAAGFAAVSVGPRILRTETAAIVGITLIQAHLGDLAAGAEGGSAL